MRHQFTLQCTSVTSATGRSAVSNPSKSTSTNPPPTFPPLYKCISHKLEVIVNIYGYKYVAFAFGDNETNVGSLWTRIGPGDGQLYTCFRGRPRPFSGVSRLYRGLLQLPSYLLWKEAAFPVLFNHFTDLVLGVMPRI
jgi:hypothetical protein